MKTFDRDVTIGDKYQPAMEITDKREADEYFEACVQHTMTFGKSREEAEKIERMNIGYYSGYYSHSTRERVEKLFSCSHPFFGKVSETPSEEEILKMGIKLGQESKEKK